MNCPDGFIAVAFVAALSAPCWSGCAGDRGNHPVTLVTVVCEAPGMTPEDVESLVTSTVEGSINGIAGVQRQGSVSRSGQASIWIQFDRGTDIYEARQLVAETLELVELPSGVEANLAPPSCGEIFLVALRREAASATEPRDELARELRDLADYSLRRQLLAIPEVSQVTVTGGRRDEYQVVVSPEHLKAFGITLRELSHAIIEANTTPDVLDVVTDSDIILRSVDKLRPLEDISTIVIGTRSGRPVIVKDVADVRIGCAADAAGIAAAPQLRSVAEELAVILAVGLRPDADKSNASARLDEVLQQLTEDLPRGTVVERKMNQRLDASVSQMLQKLRRDLPPDMQLVRRSSDRNGDFVVTSSNDRIVVKVFGPDLAVLRGKADDIRRRMIELAGVADLRVEPQSDEPRLHREVDRERAHKLGLTADMLDQAINMATGGQVVSQLHNSDRTYDLVIKTSESDVDLQRIVDTPVRIQSGELVPLSRLVEFQVLSGPAAIYHENMQRVVLVSCAVEGRDRSAVELDIRKALESILSGMGVGYYIEYGKW